MYKKRIKGSRKFNERPERARAERERRGLEGQPPAIIRPRILDHKGRAGGPAVSPLQIGRPSDIFGRMALIACKECGAEVSDQAKACPRCGRPVESTRKQIMGGLLLLAVVGYFALRYLGWL
ncbi:MAG TPA: zinc ribbon domain-containing protein [Pyrinomonadaceae bacterium]